MTMDFRYIKGEGRSWAYLADEVDRVMALIKHTCSLSSLT